MFEACQIQWKMLFVPLFGNEIVMAFLNTKIKCYHKLLHTYIYATET